ncbi:MAG TPA: hypothetical protein VM487_14275 [Phycisphaerae bacterium]|nr:hypothetical protein [Phycisphaerae bacterium]
MDDDTTREFHCLGCGRDFTGYACPFCFSTDTHKPTPDGFEAWRVHNYGDHHPFPDSMDYTMEDMAAAYAQGAASLRAELDRVTAERDGLRAWYDRVNIIIATDLGITPASKPSADTPDDPAPR